MAEFIIKYRVVSKENNGLVVKEEFNSKRDALDYVDKMRDVFYYDWYVDKTPK
jgi:hypothetical protein